MNFRSQPSAMNNTTEEKIPDLLLRVRNKYTNNFNKALVRNKHNGIVKVSLENSASV